MTTRLTTISLSLLIYKQLFKVCSPNYYILSLFKANIYSFDGISNALISVYYYIFKTLLKS